MAPTRESPWIQTYTGKKFYLLEPKPHMFDIRDIAHALSMICRFNGHIKSFYSVAEHSVYVSRIARQGMKLSALMHDAAEAYVGDMVSPLKHSLAGDEYAKVEDNLMKVMSEVFDFKYPLDPYIHLCDKVQLMAEARELLEHTPDWIPTEAQQEKYIGKYGLKPFSIPTERAEELFLTHYNIYSGLGEK